MSQKVTEAVGTPAAEAAQKPQEAQTTAEAVGTPEETQTPEEAGTQEVSRRVSLEASRFPTQEIPQDLTYPWPQDPPHYLPQNYYLPRAYYLPEDCYLPQDPTY